MIDNQIAEIAQRIKALRDLEEVSIEEMAKLTEKTVEDYEQYEKGEKEFSFSFLFSIANRLGVDITELITGENARLHKYVCVKKNKGLKMERRKQYKYQHLASVFKDRNMEPFVVTVEPKDVEAVLKHSHDGQELNYIIEGSLTMYMGDSEFLMQEGDSIYFDAQTPHAMKAENGKPCRFLAIISK